MENAEGTLSCPICADVFSDPVVLPCGHNFCRACIRAVWNEDGDEAGTQIGITTPVPGHLFCPECQVLLSPDLQLQANPSLQRLVQEESRQNQSGPGWNGLSTPADLGHQVTALSGQGLAVLTCDHCIERVSVAVRSCVTCDAALCSAHALAHQRKEALRAHTLVEPAGDLLPYRCQQHGEELRLYCIDEQVAACALCAAVGAHRGHGVVSLQEATSDLKVR